MSDSAKPKPLFFIVLGLVVAALLLYAFRGVLFPEGGGGKPQGQTGGPVAAPPTQANSNATPAQTSPASDSIEAADSNAPTTVKEYAYVAREALPPVKEKSDYQPLVNRTVKFALNVWAGWAPIILQNNGADPGVIWKTPGGEDFKVELVLIDRPGEPYLGTGESAQGPTGAALANAVFDATKARIRQVPFTPDRVKKAIDSI